MSLIITFQVEMSTNEQNVGKLICFLNCKRTNVSCFLIQTYNVKRNMPRKNQSIV